MGQRRTSSLWGAPPGRFYRLLRRVESQQGAGASVAVLGCSDGKFVLPAARRGHAVVAVDIDGTSLFGGRATNGSGDEVEMPGLVSRLHVEGLSDRVRVIHADLADATFPPVDLLFISGALQYSHNLRHKQDELIAHLRTLVRASGLLAIEYMLPPTEQHRGLDTHPDFDEWPGRFDTAHWRVLSNRRIRTTETEGSMGSHKRALWGQIICRRKETT